ALRRRVGTADVGGDGSRVPVRDRGRPRRVPRAAGRGDGGRGHDRVRDELDGQTRRRGTHGQAARAHGTSIAMNTEAWFDDPLVRPYAVTGGRTRSSTLGLDLITLVVALRTPAEVDLPQPEYARALEVCQQPISVVEVAAL